MKSGILASILFPQRSGRQRACRHQRPLGRFPRQAGRVPVRRSRQIGWVTPTLVGFELALILEIGVRRRLMVLGRVSALLPVRGQRPGPAQHGSRGCASTSTRAVALDAVLVDSRLGPQVRADRRMAMRARWYGGQSSFALAVGGIHPRFALPPGFPRSIASRSRSARATTRASLRAYFAITSNTLQFGARASSMLPPSASASGDIGFDVLIQFGRCTSSPSSTPACSSSAARATSSRSPSTAASKAAAAARHRQGDLEILWCDFSVRFNRTLVEGVQPARSSRSTSRELASR